MKQYKIFENSLGTIEIVKQGWSWPAFFFGFIWAFTKKNVWIWSDLTPRVPNDHRNH